MTMIRALIIPCLFAGALAQDLFLEQTPTPNAVEATGGIPCIACGLVLTLAVDDSNFKVWLESSLQKICGSSLGCKAAVDILVGYLERKESPDTICSSVNLCDKTCQLFPQGWPRKTPDAPPQDPPNVGRRLLRADPTLFTADTSSLLRNAFAELGFVDGADGYFNAMSTFSTVLRKLRGDDATSDGVIRAAAGRAVADLSDDHPCNGNASCIVKRFTDDHLPVFDADADAFGPKEERGLRGSHWRGADCDDKRSDVYPGRRVSQLSKTVDHDCNGINGGNVSGSFEDLFCSGTPRRGLIHLGDSATAHFHLPPQWLSSNSSGWNLDNVLADAVDELDQPACAWGTGHQNMSQCPWSAGKPTLSIAERLRQRNRCNHRDFQNIGVNGARSSSSQGLVKAVARNRTQDHPALVVFSLIGNDVCNGHPGTTHMTPPSEFKDNVLAALSALDAKLPAGSAVLMVGLVDGRVLYDTMHAVQHPVGPSYEEVYGFLNCNDETPCLGWLNSNETFRNVTSQWAASLNAEYEKIIASGHKYANFELGYFDPDWQGLIRSYVNQGGHAEDIIERTDGFHPSQLGNALLAEKIWQHLETNFSAAIGDVNPFNNEIASMFGDQGGF